MQRALYILEDRLFYFGTLLCPGLYGRTCLFCSKVLGRLGDLLSWRRGAKAHDWHALF